MYGCIAKVSQEVSVVSVVVAFTTFPGTVLFSVCEGNDFIESDVWSGMGSSGVGTTVGWMVGTNGMAALEGGG